MSQIARREAPKALLVKNIPAPATELSKGQSTVDGAVGVVLSLIGEE
jgi:hypothetical protein